MGKPSVRRRMAGSWRQMRQLIISAAIVFVFCWVLFPSISYLPSYSTPQPRVETPDETRNALFLDEDQCAAAFPGLFDSIDVQVAKGPFKLRRAGSYVIGRIKDGKIYILQAEKAGDMSDMMLRERQAALHQLSRALLTAPNPIPDTHFALNIHDNPVSASLSYSRFAEFELSSDALHNVFLMPHFAYWHWPRLPFISSLPNASHTISALESSAPFSAKIPKAVWRGTPWFASVNNVDLRKKLIAVSRDPETKEQYPWADIEQLRWETNGKTAENALNIEDFCKYKYIVYTEGVTYSGRLQFHQLCESVLITPPIAWLQHTTHLMKPVWSTELLGNDPSWQLPSSGIGGGKEKGANGRSAAHPSEHSRKIWPESKTYPPEEANAVFVAPDWSDLEEIIGFLEAHPNLASGIARRQRETFHGGGYFSPAAEVCYWRALIRGWSAVAQVPESGKVSDERGEGSGEDIDVGFWDQEGTPFELWVLDETIKPQTPHPQ